MDISMYDNVLEDYSWEEDISLTWKGITFKRREMADGDQLLTDPCDHDTCVLNQVVINWKVSEELIYTIQFDLQSVSWHHIQLDLQNII